MKQQVTHFLVLLVMQGGAGWKRTRHWSSVGLLLWGSITYSSTGTVLYSTVIAQFWLGSKWVLSRRGFLLGVLSSRANFIDRVVYVFICLHYYCRCLLYPNEISAPNIITVQYYYCSSVTTGDEYCNGYSIENHTVVLPSTSMWFINRSQHKQKLTIHSPVLYWGLR